MFLFKTVSLVLIIIIIFCAYSESTRISLENYTNSDDKSIDVSNNKQPNSPPVLYNQGLDNTKNSNNLNGNILFDKTINTNLNAYSNPQFISNVLNSSLDTIMGNSVIPKITTTISPMSLSGNANVLSSSPIMLGNSYIPSMMSGNIDMNTSMSLPVLTMSPMMSGNITY